MRQTAGSACAKEALGQGQEGLTKVGSSLRHCLVNCANAVAMTPGSIKRFESNLHFRLTELATAFFLSSESEQNGGQKIIVTRRHL